MNRQGPHPVVQSCYRYTTTVPVRRILLHLHLTESYMVASTTPLPTLRAGKKRASTSAGLYPPSRKPPCGKTSESEKWRRRRMRRRRKRRTCAGALRANSQAPGLRRRRRYTGRVIPGRADAGRGVTRHAEVRVLVDGARDQAPQRLLGPGPDHFRFSKTVGSRCTGVPIHACHLLLLAGLGHSFWYTGTL